MVVVLCYRSFHALMMGRSGGPGMTESRLGWRLDWGLCDGLT